MEHFRRIPGTISLIVLNVIVFIFSYLAIGTFEQPAWTLGLLKLGAQFNPFTLDKEWYRIFSHMFLHGDVMHIFLNMFGLFSVGSELESMVGTKKFLWVYFICGVGAALCSLYFSLFTIGVGASGAIFGLFGFAIIVSIFLSRKEGKPLAPIFINFGVFIGINLLLAKAVNADNSAHFGGLATGMLIGIYSLVTRNPFVKVRIEYILVPVLILIYFTLPRYQVTYYKFFNKILDIEETTQTQVGKNLSDEEYLAVFKNNSLPWDSALMMLNAHTYLPSSLSNDTFNLRRYIAYRKLENTFRSIMIERESYIYLDSIAWAQDSIKSYMSIEHNLSFRAGSNKKETTEMQPPGEMIQVWYDSNWVEIPSPPAAYYRIGFRDSVGAWEGSVQDFYISGDVQMKGSYKNGKRDGVFIYYSDHRTYTSAGRYNQDRSIGKWETYHNNGKLASEVFYTDRYFLRNLWDSSGLLLVKDGEGKEIHRHPNGAIATEGTYSEGNKHGYWYARRMNGDIYYEENYNHGRLVNGRSINSKGRIFLYDESSLFPLPEGGYKKLNDHIASEVRNLNPSAKGVVRLSFRVTANSVLTDINIEKSLTPELNEKAKEILLTGPKWIPAKEHGQEVVEGFAVVNVEF